MQFSDTSNREGLIQHCETLTGLGVAAISGDSNLLKDFTTLMNRWAYKTTLWIWRAEGTWEFDDESKTDLPIFTNDLVAGQQDYALPTSTAGSLQGTTTLGAALKVYRVEVLDSEGDYRLLKQIDKSEIKVALSEYEDEDGLPHSYDLLANSIFLYPAPAASDVTITDGLKLYIAREIDAFVNGDTTKEPGFAEPLHSILSVGSSRDWMQANGIPGVDGLDRELKDLKVELAWFYGDRNKGKKDKITPRRENYK